MKNLIFVCLFTLFFNVCLADQSAGNKKIEQGVTLAMMKNFDACNKEDIKATMDSCSIEMPNRDKFEEETTQVFKDKDIYYRLLECELLEVNFPYALARISQQTCLDDRSAPGKDQKLYRNSAALVPDEYVEYLNTFKYENGEWKLLIIVSEMRPFDPNLRKEAEKEATK